MWSGIGVFERLYLFHGPTSSTQRNLLGQTQDGDDRRIVRTLLPRNLCLLMKCPRCGAEYMVSTSPDRVAMCDY